MKHKKSKVLSDKPVFKTKKSLGQHFLTNSRVPELMADAGEIKKGDIVLEIGPGTGMLTRTLLHRGATVHALEADGRAITVLENTFSSEIANKTLHILHSDVRSLRAGASDFRRIVLGKSDASLTSLSSHIRNGTYKVVANIPYYLTGHLFRTFLESDTQPTDLVFLVQREVAERIARDTKESILSLSIKVYGDPHYIKTIGKGNFVPPPKIDSAILAIRNISKDRLGILPDADFFRLIHAGFSSKRKQLLGNLSILFPRETLVHTFSTLSIPSDIRAEDLSLTKWLTLIRALTLHS